MSGPAKNHPTPSREPQYFDPVNPVHFESDCYTFSSTWGVLRNSSVRSASRAETPSVAVSPTTACGSAVLAGGRLLIIFSSYRAIGAILLALLLWSGLAKLSPHSAWVGIALFIVGAGLLGVGRYLSRRHRLETASGVGYLRQNHSVFFIPVWVWGVVAMVSALPLTVHPI